jgi:hypothetical protein
MISKISKLYRVSVVRKNNGRRVDRWAGFWHENWGGVII